MIEELRTALTPLVPWVIVQLLIANVICGKMTKREVLVFADNMSR